MNEDYGLFDAQRRPIAFRGVRVESTLAGLLASSVIVQRYRNDSQDTLEITYTFPLPVDAVLLGFEVELGERKLAGEVVRRAEAEARYEEAIEAGDSAFRLMKLGAGMYSAALGNVLPGENVKISVRYAEPLKLMAGRLRFRLPTTIAPRYGEPASLPEWQRPATDLTAEYAFEARIHLQGALAAASVSSPSHALVTRQLETGVDFTIRQASMDRDFILELDPREQRSFATIVRDEEGACVMLNLLPPPREQAAAARDIVILLDCSGSMAGDSIRLAREGVLQSLMQLQAQDRFALIRFGSSTEAFAPKLLEASPHNLAHVCKWVQRTDANLGGTRLAEALRTALTYRDRNEVTRPLDVLLLTDGEVWQLDAVADELRRASARIFAVGIGTAPAEEVLRTLADSTGGACDLVTPNEDMPERIAAHFGRIRQTRITGLDIDWPQSPQWQTRPRNALYAGDAVSLFARLPEMSDAVDIRLRYADGAAQSQTVRCDTLEDDAAHTVARTAAHAMLAYRADDMVEWALRHQLITDQTDYIVTVRRDACERAHGMPQLQVTPHMLAAGWGGTGEICSASCLSPALDEACYSRDPHYDEALYEPDVVGSIERTVRFDAIVLAFIERLDAQVGGAGLAGLQPDLIENELTAGYLDELQSLRADPMSIALAWLFVLVEGLGPNAPDLPLVRDLREASARGEIEGRLVRQIATIVSQGSLVESA